MARRNPARSIGGEANLSERITRELDSRGWSPATLAERLTAAGCPIQTSAVYKIINGDPPRRITVDELLALATVFDTSVDDLLTEVDLLDKKRAQEVERDLVGGCQDLFAAADRVIGASIELYTLAADDPDLHEYVLHHLTPGAADAKSPREPTPGIEALAEAFDGHPSTTRVAGAYIQFVNTLMEQSELAVKTKREAENDGKH